MPWTLLSTVCVPCLCYKVTQTAICIDMLIDKSWAPLAFDITHGKMVQSDYVTHDHVFNNNYGQYPATFKIQDCEANPVYVIVTVFILLVTCYNSNGVIL